MLTIYNFSFHKLPQQGYDRQKKKGETAIYPLLTFNLKVGFTFSVLSPKACPYVMMRFLHATYFQPSPTLNCEWGLGLEPEGLDFAADGDDVAGGDGAHDEHCHHD